MVDNTPKSKIKDLMYWRNIILNPFVLFWAATMEAIRLGVVRDLLRWAVRLH